MWRLSLLGLSLLFASISSAQQSSCIHPIEGEVVFDVQSCELKSGMQFFQANRQSQEWFWNISPKMQNDIASKYTGIMFSAKIVSSKAQKKGLGDAQSEFVGQTIRAYWPNPSRQCPSLAGKRIKSLLGEICCDGRTESPCLYKTPYKLANVSILGAATGMRGNVEAETASRSPDYKKGLNLLKQKDYRGAAASLEKVRAAKQLDTAGLYFLGVAYYQLEKCVNVVKLLEPMQEKWEKSQFWANEESLVRKGVFLLARCHSMNNNPSMASVILNSYLSNPNKYKEEIIQARTHPDFGWIRTTKEYREFYDASSKIKFDNP